MSIAVRTERERISELLAFFERERASDVGAGLECADEYVSEALWERALHDPVRHVLAPAGKAFRAQLVRTAYRLAGGADEPPPELLHVLELLHAGSLVIDDVEDGSLERRGAPALHRVYGPALAINTGNWLYFWPATLLCRLGLTPAAELEAHRQLAATMCRAHRGQALDLALRVSELAQSEVAGVAAAIAALKTGSLMELASRLGALCAGASADRTQALMRFARSLGVALQRLDDWGSVASPRMRLKGHEDLRLERVTWPWALLAEALDAASYGRLVQQLRHDKQPASLELLRASLRRQVLELDLAERTKRELRQAFKRLRLELGAAPPEGLSALEDEIARLEVSYG